MAITMLLPEDPSDTAVAFEMLYEPRQTPFLAEAESHGLRSIAGLEMLLAQGAKSFTIWTGRAAPLEVMRAALESA